jgi:hypothetical protein
MHSSRASCACVLSYRGLHRSKVHVCPSMAMSECMCKHVCVSICVSGCVGSFATCGCKCAHVYGKIRV